MGSESDLAPLLDTPPPAYESVDQSFEVTFPNVVPRRIPVIECKVCHDTIDCTGKLHQHVMRCNTCNEATPLKQAPPGKKYIRCNCNCLLVCTESAAQVVCPRCRRHISLRRAVMPTAPRSALLRCPQCRTEFMAPYPLQGIMHCPSCDEKLHLNKKDHAQKIFIAFWLFLAFLTAGIICMICAFAIKGKDIGMDDPIAWVMFIFYSVAIITMLAGLVIAARTKVAKVVEFMHND
ncbi:Oidioi.mRNA.OKI2018_I69.XSR.g17000.t1.cds [Oikopleura dioica]|uniref:Phosphatidylinositol-4,5-bisphosphate 4-phosphatase n=1 Tax=Oikopleura dioica TaxID=34765 RepID=A0ABN7SJN8_OIKDI|nr:Oidioi.mRNA.OKI2018_I69.XSR.g17000.t1.cds [Oikopleura dioica]